MYFVFFFEKRTICHVLKRVTYPCLMDRHATNSYLGINIKLARTHFGVVNKEIKTY